MGMNYIKIQISLSRCICNITISSFDNNAEFLFGVFGYSSLIVEYCTIEHEGNWITYGQVNITQCFYIHRADIQTY